MEAMKLTLPWPPSANKYWRHNRGRFHRTKQADVYSEDVEALLADSDCVVPILGFVGLHVLFFPPDRRRRDLDNLLKIPIDALQHAKAYENDSQIKEIHARMGPVVDQGAVSVELFSLGD